MEFWCGCIGKARSELIINWCDRFDTIGNIKRKEKAMPDKKKVYVETSVISNLTARPSSRVVEAGR
jgi:hypothetical protein